MTLEPEDVARLESAPLEAAMAILESADPEAPDREELDSLSEMTDMLKGEEDSRALVDGFDSLRGNMIDIAVDYGMSREAQRIRRDLLLSSRGHVSRMRACVDLASRRLAKLRKDGGSGGAE